MTRKSIGWIVAGIGCLLLAVLPVKAQSDRPGGDGRPAARAGDEGQRGRGRERPEAREPRQERDRQEAQRGAEPKMTVIRLQHISAEAYMQVVKQLCHNPAVGETLGKVPVAMCEQANAIVVLGPPEAMGFFRELAAGLDQPSDFHERMHARQLEMSRQDAEIRQHFGPPAGGPMRGGMRPGGPQGGVQGAPMGRGPGFGPGFGGPGRQMAPQPGMGPTGAMRDGFGPGRGGRGWMGWLRDGARFLGMSRMMGGGTTNVPVPSPRQGGFGGAMTGPGQMGPGRMGMGMGGGMGVGPMGGGEFNQPMPGGMPMPGTPMPGQPMPGFSVGGGGMMPGAQMQGGGGKVSGGGAATARPPAGDEGAMTERLRQRRRAEMQGVTPGLSPAAPKEGGKPQAAPGGEGQPPEMRMLDEALTDTGMPVVKLLLSSPLTEKLHLDRKQIESIDEAAIAYRQHIDNLRQRLTHALKDAEPENRQAMAQMLIRGAKGRIEQLTAELRGRIGEVLTGEQREALEQALRAGERQGVSKSKGEPRREGSPRGESGQTGPLEAPQASPDAGQNGGDSDD